MLIGVYSSLEKAEEAKERVQLLNGFKDYKEGLEIFAYNLDEDVWKAGFSLI